MCGPNKIAAGRCPVFSRGRTCLHLHYTRLWYDSGLSERVLRSLVLRQVETWFGSSLRFQNTLSVTVRNLAQNGIHTMSFHLTDRPRLAFISCIVCLVTLACPVPAAHLASGFAAAAAVKTVTLTVDYGDGVEKKFKSIPWQEGMTILDAMEFAQKHPRGSHADPAARPPFGKALPGRRCSVTVAPVSSRSVHPSSKPT